VSRPVDELAKLHKATSAIAAAAPAPRSRRNTDLEDLANSLESIWRSKFGEVSVVAAVDIARMRGRL